MPSAFFYPLPLQIASHLHRRQMVSHGNEPVIVPSDTNVIENVKRLCIFHVTHYITGNYVVLQGKRLCQTGRSQRNK